MGRYMMQVIDEVDNSWIVLALHEHSNGQVEVLLIVVPLKKSTIPARGGSSRGLAHNKNVQCACAQLARVRARSIRTLDETHIRGITGNNVRCKHTES